MRATSGYTPSLAGAVGWCDCTFAAPGAALCKLGGSGGCEPGENRMGRHNTPLEGTAAGGRTGSSLECGGKRWAAPRLQGL